ncbi:MAG: cytochrome c family protein [Proteobacteria bacterium]|nr:cytochrome c family protein [Pseudomonadota bacterium]
MKKIFIVMIVAVFGLVSISASVHAADKGDKRKGKYAYRNVYKKCHETDPSVSLTPALSPDTKTMAQWQRVFDNKEFDQFGCKAVWDALSADDLENICSYLISGAADSPTPAKCK